MLLFAIASLSAVLLIFLVSLAMQAIKIERTAMDLSNFSEEAVKSFFGREE